MPKHIPWHLQEIFGASTIEESLDAIAPVIYPRPADVPILDTDSSLRDFQKSAGAADQIVRKIELQELTDLLAPVPEQAQLERDVLRFSKPEPESDDSFIKGILSLGSNRMQRRSEIAKGAPRRRADLREITADCLSDLLPPQPDSIQVKDWNFSLDRITDSAERLCSEMMLEAI